MIWGEKCAFWRYSEPSQNYLMHSLCCFSKLWIPKCRTSWCQNGFIYEKTDEYFFAQKSEKNLYLKFRSDDTLIHKEWRLSNYICPALYKLLGWADKKEEACVQLYFRLTTCDFTLTLLKPITYTYILVIVMQYL